MISFHPFKLFSSGYLIAGCDGDQYDATCARMGFPVSTVSSAVMNIQSNQHSHPFFSGPFGNITGSLCGFANGGYKFKNCHFFSLFFFLFMSQNLKINSLLGTFSITTQPSFLLNFFFFSFFFFEIELNMKKTFFQDVTVLTRSSNNAATVIEVGIGLGKALMFGDIDVFSDRTTCNNNDRVC